MKKGPLKIYIAGPYSAKTESKRIRNTEKAIDAAIRLFFKGHLPYTPHLTHFVDKYAQKVGTNIEWKDYMEWHNPWLMLCDALLYLGSSKGANIELEKARNFGKIVFHSIEEIPTIKINKV